MNKSFEIKKLKYLLKMFPHCNDEFRDKFKYLNDIDPDSSDDKMDEIIEHLDIKDIDAALDSVESSLVEYCMDCVYFISWQDLYDNDEEEPVDSGKCKEPFDADKFIDNAWTECCSKFKKINKK
jgi:hypothetical protein